MKLGQDSQTTGWKLLEVQGGRVMGRRQDSDYLLFNKIAVMDVVMMAE